MSVDVNCYKTRITIKRQIPFQNLRCTNKSQVLDLLNDRIKTIVDDELSRIKQTHRGRWNAADDFELYDDSARDTAEVKHESRFEWHENNKCCVL